MIRSALRLSVSCCLLVLTTALLSSNALALQGTPQGQPPAKPAGASATDAPKPQPQSRQDAQQGGDRLIKRGQSQGQGGGRGRGGRGGFGPLKNRFNPNFVRRDIPLFKEQLSFDDGQMLVVETLLNDYDLAFNPASEASQQKIQEASMRMSQSFTGDDMRERMRTMRETIQHDIKQMEVESGGPLSEEARRNFLTERFAKMDDVIGADRKATGADLETKAGMEEIVTEIKRWATERAVMKKVVVDGLEAVMNEGQTKNWPKFQRFLRREKSMGNAMLGGEATNLFIVMDEAKLLQPSIDSSAKILDDYEPQLDNALVARDDFIEQSDLKMMRLVLDGDVAGAKAIAARQISLRKAVREVNDQFRTMIVGAMPPKDGTKFNQAALASAFPEIYNPTRATILFTWAIERFDLTPESRSAVLALQVAYIAELPSMNDRIVTAIREDQLTHAVTELDRIISFMSGTISSSILVGLELGGYGFITVPSFYKLQNEREVMGRRYLEQLNGLLTPAQQEWMLTGRSGGQIVPGGRGGAPN